MTPHDEALARHPHIMERIRYAASHPETWVAIDLEQLAPGDDDEHDPDS